MAPERPRGRPRAPLPSWRPGGLIWPEGRTKILVLGGVGSRTGEAERSFHGLMRYLAQQGGYDPRRDLLEASYAGRQAGDRWMPRPFYPGDTQRPLAELAEAYAGTLEWYRDVLPDDARLCLLGYSLGGVAALDGATLALARDRAGWQGRIPAVVALAAPVRGCNAGPLLAWAWLVTPDPDMLGVLGPELDRRYASPDEQVRVERRAAFLRGQGVRVLTLADPDDAVVRPDEALLPAPGEREEDLLIRTQRTRAGSLGHGPLLDEPAVWQRIFDLVGPQEKAADPDVWEDGVADNEVVPPAAAAAPPPPDPRAQVEAELAAIKAKLRAEGRLPRA